MNIMDSGKASTFRSIYSLVSVVVLSIAVLQLSTTLVERKQFSNRRI